MSSPYASVIQLTGDANSATDAGGVHKIILSGTALTTVSTTLDPPSYVNANGDQADLVDGAKYDVKYYLFDHILFVNSTGSSIQMNHT